MFQLEIIMILKIIKISMLFFHVCRRVCYPKILANLSSKKDQCLIDLSGDFRLPENLNKKWYGIKRNKDIYKKISIYYSRIKYKK